MDIAFAMNYTNLFMIDTTPGGTARTWARIGAGINSFEPSSNETVSDDAYYDGEGMTFSDVTGGQIVHAFSGHRKYGDPAQDYIASLENSYGEQRKTTYRRIAPDGTILEGNCTIANIVTGGGDPNAKGTFSFELRLNGRPTLTEGDKAEFPASVTATAVSVKVGATSKASATVAPSTASDALLYIIDDDSIATVDAEGNVKGVKAGTTDLMVKSAVLPTVSATAKVTVTAS